MDTLSVVAVSIGPVIILGIIVYTYIQSNYQNIKDNWVENRCNPVFMPFSSMFSEESTFSNFSYCTSSATEKIMGILMEPIHLIFKVLIGVLNQLLKSIGKFREYGTTLQKFIISFATDMFGKIGNSMGAVVTLFSRIRNLTQRILGSAGYVAVLSATSINYITSLFDMLLSMVRSIVGIVFGLAIVISLVFPPLLAFMIPIGAALGITYSCFHPDTLIKMQDGTEKFMSEIKVGDEIIGGRVTAVMRFDAENIPLYDYNGVIVAGNHLVYEDGEWKYVKDSHKRYIYTGEQPREIICLNTSSHKIVINGTTFSDYEECDDEPPSYSPLNPQDTIDDIPLCELELGHETTYGKITGIVYLENDMMQIFLDNPTGYFILNGCSLARDYPDSHDEYELEKIQARVIEKLNRK